MKHLLLLLLTLVSLQAADPALKHRFLGIVESRPQLIYVDQIDPAKSWELKLPVKCRDYQLIGKNQIMLNAADGYFVYDLATRALVKEFHDKALGGIMSVRRTADGRTLLGGNKGGITITELGPDDKVLRTAAFKDLGNLRLMRLSPTGTVLFGCNVDWVAEVDLDGTVVKKFQLANAKHIYQALRRSDGHLLISSGYSHAIVECDESGKELKRFGGDDGPAGVSYHFWSGFQVLKNGNLAIANWTGHGANDSTKGHQAVELDPKGAMVWSWHDAQLAGTLHGVIVLDDLDTSVLNDDSTGVLGPVKPAH